MAVRGKKDDAHDDSSNTFADETHQGYYVNNIPLLTLHGMRGKRAITTPAETEHKAYKLGMYDHMRHILLQINVVAVYHCEGHFVLK